MSTEVKTYSVEEVTQIITNASPAQLGRCILHLAAGHMLLVATENVGFKFNNSLMQMASWVSMKKELSGHFVEKARARCLENIEFLTHMINAKAQKQSVNYSLYQRPENNQVLPEEII